MMVTRPVDSLKMQFDSVTRLKTYPDRDNHVHDIVTSRVLLYSLYLPVSGVCAYRFVLLSSLGHNPVYKLHKYQ